MSTALERLRRARINNNNNAGTSRTGSSGSAIERLRAARGITKSAVNSQPAYERNRVVKTGKAGLNDRLDSFYQKKREEDKREKALREYNENYGYAKKYAGKSKSEIDVARKSNVLNQHEKDWLNQHQYDYWDSDTLKKAVRKKELESELNTLNNDIEGMKARGYDAPSNYPSKISGIEKELESYADIDTSGLSIDQARNLLTDRRYSEEYNKWDDDTKALFDSYGEAKRELSIHHNPDKDTLTQEEFDNYLNTTKDFESKLRDLGYSDKEIKALSDRAVAQYDEKETARRLQHNLDIADKDAWHKVTVSADTVKKNVFGAIPSAVDLAMQKLLGGEDPFTGESKEINWNNPYQRDMILSQGAREHISEDMSGVGSFAYNTGMSMADFISSAALTGGSNLSSAVLASSAGTQTAHAVKQRGGSDNQALGAGAVAAVAEMMLESLSLGNLKAFQTVSADTVKEATRLAFKDYAKNIAKQAFVEGSEEFWTTLANTFADGLIMGDKSEINVAINQYIANGMSEEESTRRAWLDWGKNLALDFVGGAVSGGILGGGMSGYNFVAGNRYAKSTYGDNAADIVAAGLESPEGTNSYTLAQKYQQRLNAGKSLSGNQLSKMVDANTRQTIAENRDSVKASAQQMLSDLGETGDVDVLASAISKSVVNDYILNNNESSALVEPLTRAEKQAIDNSVNAKKVLNEMFLDELAPKKAFNNVGEEISAGNINGQLYALAGEMAAEQMEAAENNAVANQLGEINAETNQPIKNTAESENVLNRQNEVPDGKTILESTNEEVSVRKILDVNNGSVTVELADGRTTNTKDLVFGSPDEGHFYDVVAEMNLAPQDASYILNNYTSDNGLSLSEYMNGVMEAYHHGYYGLNKGEINPLSYAALLDESTLTYAHNLGTRAGNEAVVKKQATINKKAAENVKTLPKGSGNVQNKKSSGSVHFVGKAKEAVKGDLIGSSMKVIRALQKYIGNDFYIYESFLKEDNKRYWRNPDTKQLELAPNGFFKSSDGSIWLDIHAGSKGQGLILYTAGHEVTHFIKEFSPKKFKALADFLFDRVYKDGKTTATELINERLEKIKADSKYSHLNEKEAYDLAYEEVVCEACEAVFKDGNLAGMLRQMQAKDVTLYEKFVEAVKNFIAKMKSILSGYEVESKAGRLLESMHDDLAKFEVMWLDALRDAGENYRAVTEIKTDVGTVRFNERATFDNQVDAVLGGTFDKNTSHLFMGDTPKCLLDIGIKNRPMLITANHVYSMAVSEETAKKDGRYREDTNYHDLGADRVKKIPLAISEPIAIIKSNNDENNTDLVLVTTMTDNKNRPVIAAIKIDGKGSYNGVRVDTNLLKSAYGRNGFNDYFAKAIKENRILVFDKQRSQEVNGPRVQYSNSNQNLDFSNNLARYKSLVKRVYEDKSELNDKSKEKEIKRSDRAEVSPEQREVESIIARENAELKRANDYLSEMLNIQSEVSKGIKIPKPTIIASAGRLRSYAHVQTGNVSEFDKLLSEYYDYISNNINASIEERLRAARPCATWLLDHMSEKKELDPQAKDVLDTLRKTKVYLDEKQMQEVAKYYDSYNNYRTKLMGSVIISKNAATSLDTLWQELAERYPNQFSPDVNSNDMPLELLYIIDNLRNTFNTEWYDYSREMMYQDLLQQIYDSYWRASTLYSSSKKINELKYKHAEKIREVRNYHGQQTDKLRKKYRDNRKKEIVRRNQTEMRNKIKRVAADLNKMLLNPTKERYIPEGLKSSVADLMDAINFDTVGATQRIARIDRRIEEAIKRGDQESLEALEESRERIRKQGEDLASKINAFKSAYTAIKDSEDPSVNGAYDEVVAEMISETKKMVEGIVIDTKNAAGDTLLRYMTLEQLEQVYNMLKATLISIRNVNKTFAQQRQAKISDLALSAQEEVKISGKNIRDVADILKGANDFKWSMLKPDTAFRVIGSDTLSNLVTQFHVAEGKYATNIYGAKQFCQDAMKKYNYNSWDMEKEYGFISHNGKHFNLTLGQMLSLYAYSKRDQAERHLEEGGFVFDSSVTRKKEKDGKESVFKYSVDTGANYTVTMKLLGEIRRCLSADQIAFVEVMQHYLSSDMANLGNEVSLKMYGIKKYTEEHYFPLKSSSLFIRQLNEPAGEVLLKNSGFSKKLVQYAGNPIVLQDFMEVWTKHVNDMSMYNAFVMPLEDFNRVYNFQDRGDTEEGASETRKEYATLKQAINSAFGDSANSYVDNLIRELNGGVRTDPSSKFVDKSFSLFKKSAVLGSLSVVVQQPTALPRAFAYIDPKYFKGEKISPAEGQKTWEEMKKYAPVCIIKEMGSFDINMGTSTKDYIAGKHYENNVKGKAGKVLDKVDDTLSMLPGKADEITWAAIWNAVKRETVVNNPDLSPRSEEFLNKCGERFTEIIVNSQVYDSILSRSQLMRSKNSAVKMGTAFMAEPTTAVNMLVDSYYRRKRGDKRGANRIVAAVYTSALFAEVLSSIIYALRDDKEDKTYLEKYLTSIGAGITDIIIPVGYIPFVKDIYSLSLGYGVERTDMALASDIVDAIKRLSSDNATTYEKGKGIATSIASAFGIPLRNLERDGAAVINFFKNLGNNIPESWRGVWNAILDGAKQQLPFNKEIFGTKSKQEKLYDARVSGDQKYIERMESQYKDDDAAVSATRAQIKKEYQAGNISKDVAEMYLKDFCSMEEEDIYWKIKEWDEKPLISEDESYSKFNNFYAAVESGKDLKSVFQEYLDHGYEKEDLARQITSYFKPIYVELSTADKTRLKGYLLNAYVMLGYSRGKKSRDIDSWKKTEEE